MRVAMLTTWNTRCGISEYSHYLVEALRKRDDIDIKVFGSKNYDEYKVGESEHYTTPVFSVAPWNRYGDHSFDYETILEFDPEILHIQYQVMLYNQEGFINLLQRSKAKKLITYHDNCIPQGFPLQAFNLAYTHRESVGIGHGYIIPMGVEKRTPIVKTFGLGRSRKDIIERICNIHGWKFEHSFGDHNWVDREKLFNWLRDSDAIVLFYDEVPSAGVSIAARVAISTRRPTIVNDVTWFKDLSPGDNLVKVDTLRELEQTLVTLFSNTEIDTRNWDVVARMHAEDYQILLEQ